MPFLVETLHASSVESDYNQLEETLGFKIHASISKGNFTLKRKKKLYIFIPSSSIQKGKMNSIGAISFKINT